MGLTSVTDPSEFFLKNRPEHASGSALTMIMEGTRPLIVEIQALTVHSELAIPRRVAQGVPITKLQLICAILTKHLHLNLSDQDVFVNVTGGLNLREPAADLAIALAILSSFKNLPLPIRSLALGELGLLGEIRPVAFLDKRLKEAKALGYSATFTPDKFTSINKIKL
jgi:DNA repair protein RadA/Sms